MVGKTKCKIWFLTLRFSNLKIHFLEIIARVILGLFWFNIVQELLLIRSLTITHRVLWNFICVEKPTDYYYYYLLHTLLLRSLRKPTNGSQVVSHSGILQGQTSSRTVLSAIRLFPEPLDLILEPYVGSPCTGGCATSQCPPAWLPHEALKGGIMVCRFRGWSSHTLLFSTFRK